jgi:hypothetical protein
LAYHGIRPRSTGVNRVLAKWHKPGCIEAESNKEKEERFI